MWGAWGATPLPPIFLCHSANFFSFGNNHLFVVSSNKVTPRFYFIYLLISSVARDGEYSEMFFKLISRS